MNEPIESERHAGVLKPRPAEHELAESFEFGGRRLLLRGTSGPQKAPSRTAEGMPVRHETSTARTMAERSSGVSLLERRTAEGQPVQHAPARQDAAAGPTGVGQLTGGAVRRA